jgi:pyruvyl transferase EpsO
MLTEADRTHLARLKQALDPLRTLIDPARPVVYVDYPFHSNIGDLLIHQGAQAFLASHGCRTVLDVAVETEALLARGMPSDATIVLHGGGNLGDLYPRHQHFRDRVIATFPKHRIVLLPQSVHFSDPAAAAACGALWSRHADLHLCLRDHRSIATMAPHLRQPPLLLPDMAHALFPSVSDPRPGVGTLKFRRQDIEAMSGDRTAFDWDTLLTGTDHRAIGLLHRAHRAAARGWPVPAASLWEKFRDRLVRRALAHMGQYATVDTDRLHGMLAALLIGRPVTARDNSTGKLSAYHAAWLAGMPSVSTGFAA